MYLAVTKWQDSQYLRLFTGGDKTTWYKAKQGILIPIKIN